MNSFNEKIEAPEIWFQQAWELFEVSKVNYDVFANSKSVKTDKERHLKNGLMKVAMLCLGLAVENGLKGAFVFQSKPDLSNKMLDPKHFHKYAHDLNDVAGRLNLGLSVDEKVLLKRLSMFVQWAAKYKAPLNEAAFENSKGQLQMRYPSDFDFVEKLLAKLQLQSGFSVDFGWPYKS